MATPLKLRDGDGNIQELTSAEENYLTYLIGLHLAADSANGIGGITINSGDTSIGTYTDTFFNEPVGTHPSTSITSGSTATTIYQNQGINAAETDSDVKTPLRWIDAGGQTGFKEMPSSDLNAAVDRYLTTLFTNDYPGVFKLASASPGPDYSVWLSTVFSDTRTDGTSVAYNIYRRDSYTIPTEIPPMYVRNNGGFDGIQEMTDRQIKYSFGQRAKSRIGASKIGTYQLRSATAGAPTDPGTWISAGAATDTKQTTSQQEFTSVFTAAYQTNYTRGYTRVFSGTYTINYQRAFDRAYTGNAFASNYSRSFTRLASESFATNYTRNYTGNYDRRYTRAYTPNYVRRYTGNYQRAFAGSFNRGYTSLAPQNYTPTNFGGPKPNIDAQGFTNIKFPTGPAQSTIYGVSSVQWQYGNADTLSILTGAYEGLMMFEVRTGGNFFIGNALFMQTRRSNGQPTHQSVATGVLYGGTLGSTGTALTGLGIPTSWLTTGGNTVGPEVSLGFSPDNSELYVWGANWNYGNEGHIFWYVGGSGGVDESGYVSTQSVSNPFITYQKFNYTRVQYPNPGNNQLVTQYSIGYNRLAPVYIRNLGYLNAINTIGAVKPGWYVSDIFFAGVLSPSRFRLYLGAPAGDVSQLIPNVLTYAQETAFAGILKGTDAGELLAAGVGYLGSYAGVAPVSYVSTYVRDFVQNFIRNTDVNYTGNAFNAGYDTTFIRNTPVSYLRNYTGIYTSVYTGAYNKTYTPNYVKSYTGDYIGDYTSAYTNVFETAYLTDYVRAYTGNFEGLTIDATDETNETYTLYVRIS